MSQVSKMASFADIDVKKLVTRIREQTLGVTQSQNITSPKEMNGGLDEIADSEEDMLMQSCSDSSYNDQMGQTGGLSISK